MQENTGVIFRAEGLNKSFTSTKAIVDVSLEIRQGEVRGLIGENGSGKSTLSSMIAGVLHPDSGRMYFKGKEHKPKSMIDAMESGIYMLVQEMGTINGLTVWENMFLGREGSFTKSGTVDKKIMIAETRKALEAAGMTEMDPMAKTSIYSFEDRKMIEVCQALYMNPEILIVDETTTALSFQGRERVYRIIRERKAMGKTVIIISHDLEEVMSICDAVSVLRDGHYVATVPREELTEDKLRALMIGRELNGHFYRDDQKGSHEEQVVLEAKDITYGQRLKNISFQLYKGEILGIGGLSESGMHELCKILFGAVKPDTGEVLIPATGKKIENTAEAIENKIAYMPKNRDQESLMLGSSIEENICLPSYNNLKRHGLIDNKKARELAAKFAGEIEVKMQSPRQLVKELSGGNKQKVVVAKWLANGSDIFFMDCPTRGIDVGVKAHIYSLMMELKQQGKSIIMISEEMPELIGMSDRIIILKDGVITGELSGADEITEEILIQKII